MKHFFRIIRRHASCSSAAPALAADKRVFRIDSLIATQKGGEITLAGQGRGADRRLEQAPAASDPQ